MRIAVLASGTGTILSSLIEAEIPIALVLTDRHCGAEKVAEQAGIATIVVERTDFSPSFDRSAYSTDVTSVLDREQVDLVVMAGFGTVLGASLHDRFGGRILNTHPALLPSFKGWHAVRDTLAAGVKVTGCTVHLATLEVDEGPILAQQAVPVLPDDTEASLHERIKAVERHLYPATIKQVIFQLEQGEAIS